MGCLCTDGQKKNAEPWNILRKLFRCFVYEVVADGRRVRQLHVAAVSVTAVSERASRRGAFSRPTVLSSRRHPLHMRSR